MLPGEVILVRVTSSFEGDNYWIAWSTAFAQRGVRLQIVQSERVLFPGAARNLGLQRVHNQWVAFLDVETIPCERWLEEQLVRIESSRSLGSFGSTNYAASSIKETLVRDAIYGRLPLQTLPGSVLRKDLFDLVGKFIPGIRAAEDTEWMIRSKAMGLKIICSTPQALISYRGLTNRNLSELLRKWRRNYLSSRQLQHLKVQTTMLWLGVYVIGSLAAFNWNALVAGWQVDSPFYVDHVTKIVSLIPIILYILIRGCYLPFKRGVPFSDLFPSRFLLLAAVGFILDAVKVSTILIPKAN